MRITDARVFVTCPGRNFVARKIRTDEGVTGIGDATLNGRELAVAELAGLYPYRPAALPVNRLEEGTMHSW